MRELLTERRLRAAICAIAAMLAGEEGEGDWPPDVSADDLRGAQRALMALLPHYKTSKRSKP